MRFFKASQPPRTAADEAAAVRLRAVASRGKGKGSLEWMIEPSPESSDEAPEPDVLQ